MILRVLDLVVLVGFFATIPLMVIIQHHFNFTWDLIASQFKEDETAEVYDFIVVGSGSAGSVVVNRLSKNNKVLLIEAGGDPLYYNSIPGLALDMLHRPEVDWMHKTVPQKYSQQGMEEKRSLWPRGKLLGGTSNLNYMLYVRGLPQDYEAWANITGDDNWSYNNLLPYFKKGLHYDGKYKNDEKHYGSSAYGTLNVEARSWSPLSNYFIEAAEELGIKNLDINAPQRTGIARLEVTQKQGKRFGTFFAFLKDIQHRKNLRISRYSQATKIKLDKNNNAVGVWYIKNGKTKFARASKEIIIAGGAVDSPKLLLLSGIGPKNHLKEMKIKVKVDLPGVGQNLYDHLSSMVPFVIDQPLSLIPERDMGISTFKEYFLDGKGVLTCPTGFNTHAFFCTKLSNCKEYVQLYFSSVGVYENLGNDISRGMGVTSDLPKYFEKHVGKDGFIIMPTLLQPKSVGFIQLKNKNPLEPPIIDPKYLEDKNDVLTLVEGIKMAIKISEETKSLKRINAKLLDDPYPGCEKFKFRSDEYWECYIRKWAFTLYHPIGTCRMGKSNDPKTVVDSQLRVLKTHGLRVSDASIMPKIVSGNTNAPSIMVGEKAADIIREYWAKQYGVTDHLEWLINNNFPKKCFYSKLP